MKKYLILSFLLSFIQYSIAQKALEKKDDAKEQLIELHDGYLFFQFFDREVTKASILKVQGQADVDDYDKNLRVKQAKLMEAFSQNYSFSKIAFFYSHDAQKIKNGDFSSVQFYNGSNQLANNDTIDFNHFYIAEMSRIELDSSSYTDENGVTKKSPEYSFSGLIMRDRHFVQLDKPFPFYVRTMEGALIFEKKPYRLARAFDGKLSRHYTRWSKVHVSNQ